MDDAEQIIATLRPRGQSLATCESLTGGLVAAAITDVAGSSDVFRGGLVTYATELKVALAHVAQETAAAGVVTEQTATEMALGAQTVCGADWAIATTGVAGPGPSDGVAAGTVWVCVAGPAGPGMAPVVFTEELHLDGDRDAVRHATVEHVLAMLLHILAPAEKRRG